MWRVRRVPHPIGYCHSAVEHFTQPPLFDDLVADMALSAALFDFKKRDRERHGEARQEDIRSQRRAKRKQREPGEDQQARLVETLYRSFVLLRHPPHQPRPPAVPGVACLTPTPFADPGAPLEPAGTEQEHAEEYQQPRRIQLFKYAPKANHQRDHQDRAGAHVVDAEAAAGKDFDAQGPDVDKNLQPVQTYAGIFHPGWIVLGFMAHTRASIRLMDV